MMSTIHGMYAIHVNMHHDYADNDMQLNFVEENVIMLHVNINEFQVNITICSCILTYTPLLTCMLTYLKKYATRKYQ